MAKVRHIGDFAVSEDSYHYMTHDSSVQCWSPVQQVHLGESLLAWSTPELAKPQTVWTMKFQHLG